MNILSIMISNIDELVEEFLSPFRCRLEGDVFTYCNITLICKIIAFEFSNDLREDPLVRRFLSLVHELKQWDSSDNIFSSFSSYSAEGIVAIKRRIVTRIFDEVEELFICVINGYYSKNNSELIQRVSDFLEILTTYCELIPETALIYVEDNPMGIVDQDDIDFNMESMFDTPIKIRDGKLVLMGDFQVKVGDKFVLNEEKVNADKAFEYLFYKNHLYMFY